MDMGLFSKKRTFAAVLHDIRVKMVKAKKAKGERGAVGAGESKKVIELKVYIQLTKAMKELVDPRLASLINLAEANGEVGAAETPINKVGYDKVERTVRLAVKNAASDKEPVWVRGGAPNDDPAKVTLKSVVVVEQAAYIVIVAQVRFGADVWNWGGDIIEDGVCKIEMTPVQLELPLESGAASEGEPEAKGKKE